MFHELHKLVENVGLGFLRIGCGAATSGDYEATFCANFSRNHIFNLHTYMSRTKPASATVNAPRAKQVDGLSTMIMMIGAQKALALTRGLAAVEVVLIGNRWDFRGYTALSIIV